MPTPKNRIRLMVLTCWVVIVGALPLSTVSADVTLETLNNVEEGHEFLVRVYVADVSDLYGCAFDLNYDPQRLQVVKAMAHPVRIWPKVLEGQVLNVAETEETLMLAALEDNTPGIVTLGVARRGAVGGVDVGAAAELLLSVHFKAVAPGASAITIGAQDLRDSALAAVAASWDDSDGNLTIAELVIQSLDLNDDGVVDLKDLILAIQVQSDMPVSEQVFVQASVSPDNRIGMPDALSILKAVVE